MKTAPVPTNLGAIQSTVYMRYIYLNSITTKWVGLALTQGLVIEYIFNAWNSAFIKLNNFLRCSQHLIASFNYFSTIEIEWGCFRHKD